MINKDNNPWLGLSSYQTSDSSRFFGREREMEEIGNSIKDNYCTILYGVSGAGKTSIINAGLCPKLSSEGYLPITIRLDHNGRVYSDQIISACFSKFEQTETELEYPFNADNIRDLDARDALWIFFHASTFWSKDNRKVVPVLFIDQFEELFTLAGTEEQKLSFFRQIDSLFSSVPSERLISYLEASNSSFDFSGTPQFRMVFSMREDFLARLEDYCYDLPILRKNRIGLRKMNGIQALEVIMKPQPGLVTEDVALKILSAVTGKSFSGNIIQLQTVAVDTSILSLFCSELFKLSADKAEDIISTTTVEAEGRDILKRFYEKNISVLSKRGRRYLEQHLLTSSGFRNQLAVEDINRTLIKESDIQALESSRIIRKEIINGTERIEFTHDILCKAAMENIRKNKDIDLRILSILRYSFLLLVSLYVIHQILGLSEVVIYDWFRNPPRYIAVYDSMTVFVIRKCLYIIWGFLYFPLFISREKSKYPLVDIFLILYSFLLVVVGDHMTLYYMVGKSHFRLTQTGWVVLLTIIPIYNLVGRFKRQSLKEYCKNLFRFSFIKSDMWAKRIVLSTVLFGCIFAVRMYSTALYVNNINGINIFFYLHASITIVVLFFISLELVIPISKKRLIAFYFLTLTCSTFAFLLSQYSHVRVFSFLAFVSIILFIVFFLKGFIKASLACKQYLKTGYCLLCSVSFVILPNYISSINILALKNNARARSTAGCVRYAKIIAKDGFYGVMDGASIIVPPIYKSISEEKGKNWMWWNADYTVIDKDGKRFAYVVLEHPEYDNRFTRKIPSYVRKSNDNTYIVNLAVNYYYQKAVVEGKTKYLSDFDAASKKLFCLYSSIPYRTGLSLYDMIKESGIVDYDNLYRGCERIMSTKAIESKELISEIDAISHYGVFDFESVNEKGEISLIKDIELISDILNGCVPEDYLRRTDNEELLLISDILFYDDTDACLKRIADLAGRITHGKFYGEVVLDAVMNISNGNLSLAVKNILDKYIMIKRDYEGYFTVNIISSHRLSRRSDYNSKYVVFEDGKVIAEYDRIVYGSNSVGVYFKDGKRGFIDEYANEITPPIFDHAWVFSPTNNIALVETDGKVGFVNQKGNVIKKLNLPLNNDLRYYRDWIFEEDKHLVFPSPNERKFGLLDINGNWIVCPQYPDIDDLTYGFRVFGDKENNRLGVMDKNGDIVLPQKYYSIDIDYEYIEARDTNRVISYFKHDQNKIIGRELEKERI